MADVVRRQTPEVEAYSLQQYDIMKHRTYDMHTGQVSLPPFVFFN